MNSNKRSIDYVLDQEKYAQEQVDLALKEKDDILKKAKEAAKKEITTYEEAKREDNIRKTTELHSNRAYIEDIEHKNKIEISEVEKEFRKNKDSVIEYLFNHVIKVDIIVPDVVKGKFEEKFGVQS